MNLPEEEALPPTDAAEALGWVRSQLFWERRLRELEQDGAPAAEADPALGDDQAAWSAMTRPARRLGWKLILVRQPRA